MKKKFLSSLLALCMVLSMLPVTAFAASETAAYDAVTAVLTITGTGLPTGGTLAPTKVTITGGGADVTLSAASSATLNSATAITIAITGVDKTAVDKLFANGAAEYTIAFADKWDGSAAAIAAFAITATNIPAAPTGLSIDYAQELITGYATATMEYSTDGSTYLSTNDLADATAFAAAKLIPATLTQDLYVRVKAADPKPAGIATKLTIPARPKAPDNSTAAVLTQPTIDTGVGKTNVKLNAASEFKITDSTEKTVKQEWTTGTGAATLTTNTTALVNEDLIWVRTAAVVGSAFASAAATSAQLINTEDIGVADKSTATVTLGDSTVVAGAGATLNITDAKGTDGTALATAVQVTVTSSDTTNDGTTGKVFEDNVTFAAGVGTVTIPGTALKKVGDGTRTLTVKITGVTDAKVTFTTNTLTVNPAAAAKLVVTQQPTAPATNGAVLKLQPVVQIQDKYDNVCTTDSTTKVTAAVTSPQTWTLGGTKTATASSGVATFTGLAATSTAEDSTATITFTSGALTAAASTPAFTIPAPVDVTAPTLSTATINGTALVLTYNEDLKTTPVPATTDFTVTGIAAGNTVKSVAIAGSAVTLTMEKAAVSTDTVTVSYTVPGTNKIQDTAGNAAVALTSNAVTNNTAAVTPSTAPAFAAQGNTFTMTGATVTTATYTLKAAVANTTYKVYDTDNSTEVSKAGTIAVDGAKLTLTLTTAPTKDANYYISATETGKTESDRVGVMIKAYVKSNVATITASGTTLGTVAITGTFTGGVIGTPSALTVTLPAGTTSGNLVLKVDAGATVKYVKAATAADDATITGTTTNESGTVTQNLTGIANGDAYIIGVTAENGTTKLYYKLTITVTPADIGNLTITVNPTTGVVTGDTATDSGALAYYLVTASKKSVIDTWNKETASSVVTTALGTAISKPTLTFANNGKFLVVVETKDSKVVAAGESAVIAVASPFKITEIGAEAAGGAGKVRTITCTGSFTNEYLVIQMTEGTGADAKVSVVMVKAADSVTVSYKTTAKVQAWITSGMPKLTGVDATNATIYDTLTATTSAAVNHA